MSVTKSNLSDIRSLLSNSAVYEKFQNYVGGTQARKTVIDNYLSVQAGDRLIDIGCGPGYVLDFFPEIDYYGFDLSERYIAEAKEKYGDRGHFFCQDVNNFPDFENNCFDFVTAFGVLHHLNDAEANILISSAHRLLKPGGKFLAIDGVYEEQQSRIRKILLDLDRGEYVRFEDEYLALLSQSFSAIESNIEQNMFTIPYTLLISIGIK